MILFAADINARLEAANRAIISTQGTETEDNRTRRIFTLFLLSCLFESIELAKGNPGRNEFVEGSSTNYGVMDYMLMLARFIFLRELDQVPNYLKRE